jgi:dTDP-4-dehydrorhamnose reductase
MLKDDISKVLPASFKEGRDVFGIITSCISQIDLVKRERKRSRALNVDATVRLIDDLLGLGIKPVFISTSSVFDGSRGGYIESDLPSPICEYGLQKLEVEDYLRRLKFVGSDSLTIRLDKVFGYHPGEKHAFTEWMISSQEGKSIVCIKDQYFSPVFVEDVGAGIIAACKKNLGGMYHFAGPEFYSREELARKFLGYTGLKVDVESRPMSSFDFADPRPLNGTLISEKFVDSTGFEFLSLEDGLGRFVELSKK